MHYLAKEPQEVENKWKLASANVNKKLIVTVHESEKDASINILALGEFGITANFGEVEILDLWFDTENKKAAFRVWNSWPHSVTLHPYFSQGNFIKF